MNQKQKMTLEKSLEIFLKENYKVNFVRADEYAKIYMKQNPRPGCARRENITRHNIFMFTTKMVIGAKGFVLVR